MATYRNDIFKIISLLDKRSFNFFKELDQDQTKELQPYTLLRWLSCVNGNSQLGEQYILKTNKLVNETIFNLGEHKELLLNLLCSCGTKQWVKHGWIPINKSNKAQKDEELYRKFYNLNEDEWNIKKDTVGKEEIIDVRRFLGLEDKNK